MASPALFLKKLAPSSSGQDIWFSSRRSRVRFPPGSLSQNTPFVVYFCKIILVDHQNRISKKIFVYILCSLVDGTYYIGSTSGIDSRTKQHNKGKSRYTSGHRPYELVYSESFLTRLEAEGQRKSHKEIWQYKEIFEIAGSPDSIESGLVSNQRFEGFVAGVNFATNLTSWGQRICKANISDRFCRDRFHKTLFCSFFDDKLSYVD